MIKHRTKDRRRRGLAVLLSLALLFGGVPHGAYAAGDWTAGAQARASCDEANTALAALGQVPCFFASFAPAQEGGSGTLAISRLVPGQVEPVTDELILPAGVYVAQFPKAYDKLDISAVQVNGAAAADPANTQVAVAPDGRTMLSYTLTPPEAGEADGLDDFVTSVTLRHGDKTAVLECDGQPPVLEGLTDGDQVELTYAFAISDPVQAGFQPNVPYKISIPQHNFSYTTSNLSFAVKNTDRETVANVEIHPEDATATITFAENVLHAGYDVNGSFTLTGRVTASGKEGDTLSFTIGGKPVEVALLWAAGQAVVTKTEESGNDQVAKWNITVTPPAGKCLPEGLVLTDTMTEAGAAVAAHGFKRLESLTVGGQPLTADDYALDTTDPSRLVLTLKKSFPVNQPLAFVFYSGLTEAGYQAALAKKYTGLWLQNGGALDGQAHSKNFAYTTENRVTVTGPDGQTWGEASAQKNLHIEPIYKTGTAVPGAGSTSSLGWELMLNANFMTMPAGTTVTDTLPSGLTYQAGSLAVYTLGGDYGNPLKPATYTQRVQNAADYVVLSERDGVLTFTLARDITEPIRVSFITQAGSVGDAAYVNEATLHDFAGHTVMVRSTSVRKAGECFKKLGTFIASSRSLQWGLFVGATDSAATITDTLDKTQYLYAARDNAAIDKDYPLPGAYYNANMRALYLDRLTTNVAQADIRAAQDKRYTLTLGKPTALDGENGTTATASYERVDGKQVLTLRLSGPVSAAYRLSYYTYAGSDLYFTEGQDAYENSATICMADGSESTSTAQTSFWSPMLAKSGVANREDGTVTWTVKVNGSDKASRNAPFFGGVLTDTLDEAASRYLAPTPALRALCDGQTVYAGALWDSDGNLIVDVKKDSTQAAEKVKYTLALRDVDGRQQIELRFEGVVTSLITVTLPMQLTQAGREALDEGGLLTLGNSARLTGAEFSDPIAPGRTFSLTKTAEVTFENLPVEKLTPQLDVNDHSVAWTVLLNQNHMPLTNVGGVAVRDVFTVSGGAASLVDLDPSSVRLSYAQDADNKNWVPMDHPLFVPDGEHIPDGQDYFTYDSETKVFSLHLVTPAAQKNGWSRAYKLDYKTAINVPQDYEGKTMQIENEVKWIGNTPSTQSISIDITKLNAQIDFSRYGSIRVLKCAADEQGNPDTDKPLAGASFMLYDEAGQPLRIHSSGTDGYVAFDRLKPGSYTVVETRAPEGYERSAERYTVEVRGSVKETGYAQLIVPNRALTGGITLTKLSEPVDGKQTMLPGATFALLAADGETVLDTQTTGLHGQLTFRGLHMGEYYVQETQAPHGYALDDQLIPVTVSRNAVTNNRKLLTVTNALATEAPPVAPETPLEPPVAPENPEQPPVVPENPEQPPVAPENPEQPPVAPENPEQPPVAPENPEQPPVVPENPEQPPVAPENPEQPPVAPENPEELPVTPENPQEPGGNGGGGGGGGGTIVVDTTNRTPEEIDELIAEGYVPLGDFPAELTTEDILENSIPLVYFLPEEPVPTAEITIDDGAPLGEPSGESAPRTGDHSPVAALALLAAAAAAGLILLKKRETV